MWKVFYGYVKHLPIMLSIISCFLLSFVYIIWVYLQKCCPYLNLVSYFIEFWWHFIYSGQSLSEVFAVWFILFLFEPHLWVLRGYSWLSIGVSPCNIGGPCSSRHQPPAYKVCAPAYQAIFLLSIGLCFAGIFSQGMAFYSRIFSVFAEKTFFKFMKH